MQIYKILRRPEWDALRAVGFTLGAPVDLADGFIHFSTAAQAPETAAKHFAGVADLVLAVCEAEAMGPELKWEVSRGGALFPHLYRPLALTEVVQVHDLPLGPAGHIFPEALQ